jgi:hypothetical protein
MPEDGDEIYRWSAEESGEEFSVPTTESVISLEVAVHAPGITPKAEIRKRSGESDYSPDVPAEHLVYCVQLCHRTTPEV